MAILIRLTESERNERNKHLNMIASKLYAEGLRYSTFTTKKAEVILKNTVASRYNIELLKRFPYRIKIMLRNKQVYSKQKF